jgi:DNA-binding CsgD family transcriptional regulator
MDVGRKLRQHVNVKVSVAESPKEERKKMVLLDKLIKSKQSKTETISREKQVALLTPREHDLYLLLMEGYTLMECALKLSVKYSTANTHMTSVYRKLEVNSRAELIINYRDIGK